jgi:glycosyl transferase family 25
MATERAQMLKPPPVFVINMAKDESRREIMASRLDRTGVGYEFFPAVDGRGFDLSKTPAYDGAKRRRYFGRDMIPGEVGCLLSHRAVYEKMAAENIPYAVVLEDDVIFEADFKEALQALLATKIKWDVIRFLGSKKIYARGCRKIAKLTDKYWLARLPTAPGGAHGYVLTLHAAKIMLKHMQRNWLPIDTLQGRMWETGLETLVLYPAPVQIDNSESTIGEAARMDKTVKLTGIDKTLYPLYRGIYKVTDTLGKRYVYWSSFSRDKKNGGHDRD